MLIIWWSEHLILTKPAQESTEMNIPLLKYSITTMNKRDVLPRVCFIFQRILLCMLDEGVCSYRTGIDRECALDELKLQDGGLA